MNQPSRSIRSVRPSVALGVTLLLTCMLAPPSTAQAPSGALTCPFCEAPHIAAPHLCQQCGRLVLDHADPTRRSWIDASFALHYPFPSERPSFDLEFDDAGLFVEAVTFATGDRYEGTGDVDHLVITGKVRARNSNQEVKFQATETTEKNEIGRIVSKEVVGVIKGKSARHLYRKLNYRFDYDHRIQSIEVLTWQYRKAGDRTKAPSTWLEHERAELVARYEVGTLIGFDVTVHEAERDLRGAVSFKEPVVFVEELGAAGDSGVAVSAHPSGNKE